MPLIEYADVDVEEQNRVLAISSIVMKFVPMITVPIYIEAFYCLIKGSKSFKKYYTILLTAHIIACFIEELYGFLLLHPMVFLPVFGVYADGLLSALGIHPFIQLGGMYLCVQVSSAILTHITFYRMKIIIPMSYRYYTRVIRLGIFATVFVYVSSVMSVFTILFLAENQADAKAYLSVNLRPLPGVFWSDKFIVSSPLNGCAWLFLVSGAICVGFYVVLCITLPAICFAILYRSKDSLSAKIIKAQTDYLRTILLQVVAVILCVIMPLSVFFAATAYTYTNSMITVLSIMLSNFHGVTSTILHLFSNKPFRQTMKSQLSWIVCCLTCTRPKRKNTIHTMSSIVG